MKKTKKWKMKKSSRAARSQHRGVCLLAGALLALAAPALADRREIIPAEMAPKAGANAPMFSPGILVDGTLYVAGQLGNDLKTGQIPDDFDQEVKNSIERIGLILKEAGMDYSNVVSVTVYLSDMELFGKMNGVYATYFKTPRPVRAAIGVAKLAAPKGRIEISVIAKK